MKKTSKALASTAALCLVLSTTSVFAAETSVVPERLSGANRVSTAISIAQESFNGAWKGKGAAILSASADANLVDSLAVAPLSYQLNAPILLNDAKDSINAETLKTLKANGVKTVYIATGEGVISNKAKAQLEKEGMKVERLGGKDRYETAKNILDTFKKNGGSDKTVALVSGSGLADALSVAPEAAKNGMPILLTNGKDAVASNLQEVAKAADKVYAIGGNGVISDALLGQLKADRLGGNNRYETNARVIKEFASDKAFSKIYLGNGQDAHLVDSLTGSVLAAQSGSPIVLADGKLAEPTKEALKGKIDDKTGVVALGGEAVVSNDLAKEVLDMASESPEYIAADKAVKAYEDAKITTSEEIAAAKALKAPAVKAVEAVKDATQKEALNARIAAKDKAIAEAEAKMELKVESVSAINATQVEVKFSQPVDKATVFTSGLNNSAIITANFAFTGIDGTAPTAPTGKLSADGKTLVITANNNSYEERFKVVIDNVKTTDGKDIVEYDQIVNLAKDTVAPTVLGVEKLTSSTFKVKFSEPMKTLGTPSYKLANGTAATTVTSDFASGKQDVVFTLGSGIDAGDVVTATFVGAQDQASNLINPNPTSVTFTKGDKDGVRPEVSSVTPKGLNKFELKFSEEVQNLLVGNIYVDGTALTAFSTPNGTTITQDAVDKTKYEVELAGTAVLTAGLHKIEVKDTGAPATSVIDLSGEILKDFSQILEFKADTVAPKFVSSSVVVDAATQKEKLVLTFDKEIAQPAAFTTIVATELTKGFVTTTGVLDAGQLIVNADNKKQLEVNLDTVKFSTANLEKDATYTVKFPKGYVKGGNTVDVEAFNVTFKRGQDGTVVADAPTVSTVTAPTNDTITVLFDKALDGATATNAANYTIPGLVIEKAELGLDSAVAKKVTLTLAKGTNTANGDRNLTIKNVKAKDGKEMTTVTKLVSGMKENVAPTVTSAKFTGVTGGNVDKITLTFSEAVKATDATTDIFEIYVGDSTTAAAVSNVDISGNTDNKVELTVTSPLTTAQIEKGITVKVKTANKVVDLNNNKLDFTSIVATY